MHSADYAVAKCAYVDTKLNKAWNVWIISDFKPMSVSL